MWLDATVSFAARHQLHTHRPEPSAPLDRQAGAIDAQRAPLDLVGGARGAVRVENSRRSYRSGGRPWAR
jgi:hypothetical protein